MSLFKKASSPLLAAFLLATTLPISCAPPTADTGNVGANSQNAVSTNNAALSGIVSRGRGTDGRFVPPETPVTIIVKDGTQEVAQGTTDSRGRFYIGNIPADTDGTRYSIVIPNTVYGEKTEILFGGQVKDLSNIDFLSSDADANNQSEIRYTGRIVNPNEQPLSNLIVRDKSRTYTSVRTDENGAFALNVTGKEIEASRSDNPDLWLGFDVDQLTQNEGRVILDFDNVRSISGTVKDISNSQIPIANAVIRVSGQSVSTRSDENGNYELNGVPRSAVALEVIPPEEYSRTTVQIPPAETGNDTALTRDIQVRGIGSLQVNFTAESVKGEGCIVGYNCRRYDINPPFSSIDGSGSVVNDQSEAYYHNTLGTINTLTATVRIEGTDLSQTVDYPPAPLLDLRGTDRLGELVTLPEAVTAPNQVVSVSFDNVPGGAQRVTISLTGHQTQKSIPVFVPAKDTISTELITLYTVQPVTAMGDVKGFVRGLPNLDSGQVRIAYIDVSEDLGIFPSAGETINNTLLDKMVVSLRKNKANTIVNKETGEYYLKNVPTGSRIMLVAASVKEEDGVIKLSDCYIPNASVLLNVKAGQVNLAPDLTLTRRNNEPDCAYVFPEGEQ